MHSNTNNINDKKKINNLQSSKTVSIHVKKREAR